MAWTQTANIRGASGQPGASGAIGATGPTGATGPIGATGGTGGTGGPGTTTWADIVDKPGAILNYKGTWNASTNTPTLSDSTGSGGDVYRVSVGASRNLGSGTISWEVSDYAIYSPVTSSWEKADTTDAVSSVAGRTGAVTLTSADLGASGTPSASTFLRGDNTWAAGPIGATGASGGTGATGGTGAAGVNYSRVVQTVTTTATTLGASGSTDYVVFANIPGDASLSNVSLLLNMNGENNSTSFVDASPSPLTITRNGDTKISTAHSKFGGASAFFDGTGDYLSIADNAALEFGSGNLTWEMWVKTTSSDALDCLMAREPNTSFGTGYWSLMMNYASATAGDVVLFAYEANTGAPFMLTTGASIRDDAWHHIAVVRNGSAWNIYIDGTSRASGTFAGTIADISQPVWIGGNQGYGRYYNGYIDSLRLTKGQARYTANFTAPTAEFPTVASTLTMPSATSNSNRYSLRNVNSSAVVIGASGAQAINGATGGLSLASNATTELISDGMGWYSF